MGYRRKEKPQFKNLLVIMTKLDEVLRSAIFELDRSERAYKAYLPEKKYLHAKALKRSNERLITLITKNSALFTGELRDCCLELIEHMDVWFDQFAQLEQDDNPSIEDPFVFKRIIETKAFPKGLREVFVRHLEFDTL